LDETRYFPPVVVGGAENKTPAPGASEELPEIVAVDPGVAEVPARVPRLSSR
jgi:hypothetical protein